MTRGDGTITSMAPDRSDAAAGGGGPVLPVTFGDLDGVIVARSPLEASDVDGTFLLVSDGLASVHPKTGRMWSRGIHPQKLDDAHPAGIFLHAYRPAFSLCIPTSISFLHGDAAGRDDPSTGPRPSLRLADLRALDILLAEGYLARDRRG